MGAGGAWVYVWYRRPHRLSYVSAEIWHMETFPLPTSRLHSRTFNLVPPLLFHSINKLAYLVRLQQHTSQEEHF